MDEDAMKIIIDSEIIVENPTKEVRDYFIKKCTFDNPDYVKKSRMGFWTGNVPKKLKLYREVDNSLIIPHGLINDVAMITIGEEYTTEYRYKSQGHIDYCTGGEIVSLYDYQQEAKDEVIFNEVGILQSPAGSGKTRIGIAAIKELGRKSLWIASTKELIDQAKNTALQFIDKSHIGTITEGKVDIKDITFATVQTLSKLDLLKYRYMWDVIIVDECHRIAVSGKSVGMFQKVLDNLCARYKIGLSATVHRADGMIEATKCIIGDVFHEVPKEAVAERVVPVKIYPQGVPWAMSEDALGTDGMINYTKLIGTLCEDQRRNREIAEVLENNAQYSGLVLSSRVTHLKAIRELLPDDLKEQSVLVDGSMVSKKAKAERVKAIEQMRSGEKKLLFATYKLASEGLDIPRLERLYLVAPQKDYAVITQSVGRIARKYEGKADPVVIDFVDVKIPMLVKMWKKRCTIYRKGGYDIILDK